jgi:hypothetical protein
MDILGISARSCYVTAAPVDAAGPSEPTPLALAIEMRNLSIIDLLLSNGAKLISLEKVHNLLAKHDDEILKLILPSIHMSPEVFDWFRSTDGLLHALCIVVGLPVAARRLFHGEDY